MDVDEVPQKSRLCWDSTIYPRHISYSDENNTVTMTTNMIDFIYAVSKTPVPQQCCAYQVRLHSIGDEIWVGLVSDPTFRKTSDPVRAWQYYGGRRYNWYSAGE
eukprot:Sspe_Gene.110794::Locus_91872_Transcript_1_1_Confidence_1.000_Length_364::g.110794::m.110794